VNSIKFLYAAYIATWLIHGLYLLSIARRYKRVRESRREADKQSAGEN
jgi:CcmD family protein